MSEPAHLLLPFVSSLLYVGGAILLKRAGEMGVGVGRATFVGNIIGAAFFTSLLTLGGPGQPWTQLWQPAIVALLLLIGQCLTFVALTRGDVSVATPVFGVKNVLVAFFTTLLLSQTVPLKLWIAAALSTVAVALLNSTARGRHHDLGLTVLCAILASGSFALFDVLVQKWSPAWGAGRFLPIMNGFAALYSFLLIPLFRAPLRTVEPRVWPWLLGGAMLIALQGVLFISTIAVFSNATAANIVYSVRGVWSVLAVWWFGRWLGSREQDLSRRTMAWRLAGAGLMTAAIIAVTS
jgi:drug/metabolite transporter (DMT)-like permease